MVLFAGDNTPIKTTPRLNIRPGAGFFNAYETPRRRSRRFNLLKISTSRSKVRNIRQSASGAMRAAAFRKIMERNRRETEDSALEANEERPGLISIAGRLAERVKVARDRRERAERQKQAVDIEAARRRVKAAEAENRSLTQEQAQDRLAPTPFNKKFNKNLEKFRKQEAKLNLPGELAERMDRYLPAGTKLVIKGKNEARFNEETGFVEISRDLLDSPGAAGILAHEGAHAVEKGLSDRTGVMSRLRKAWADLSNSEQDSFFSMSARVLNQEGQTNKENRYGVGGPQELFADIMAVSNLQGDNRVPASLLAAMSSDDERQTKFLEHQLKRMDHADAAFDRKLSSPSLGEMSGVIEVPPLPPGRPEEFYKWQLKSMGDPSEQESWKWVQVEDPQTAKAGTQTRFEEILDGELKEYQQTYNQIATFGSDAYESAENKAMNAWKNEFPYDENDVGLADFTSGVLGSESLGKAVDVVTGAAAIGGLFGSKDNKRDDEILAASRHLREEFDNQVRPREVFEGETKYDLLLKDVDNFLTNQFITHPLTAQGKSGIVINDKNARKFAEEVRKDFIRELEGDIREELGDQANNQEVREYVFASLNMQKYLQDYLTETNWPQGEGLTPPAFAVEEAERRHLADVEGMFGGFPSQPGLLERVLGAFDAKWIPTQAIKFGAFRGTTPGADEFLDLEEDRFLSLDDIHGAAQVVANPIAGFVLRGDIPIPTTTDSGALAFDSVKTGTGLSGAVRVLEEGAAIQTGQKFSGRDTDHTMSNALKSQLAQDILSEVISPDYIMIALPFAGAGVAARAGQLAKTLQITSNLVGLGGLEVAGPLAVARLARFGVTSGGRNLRSILRGLTAVAKDPAMISRIPQATRDTPLFKRGLKHIQEWRAGDVHFWGSRVTPRIGDDAERFLSSVGVGRESNYTNAQIRQIAVDEGLNVKGLHRDTIIERLYEKQYMRQIRADNADDVARVAADLKAKVDIDKKFLPLVQAIKEDLQAGRTFKQIIKSGVKTRAAPFSRRPGQTVLYHGASSLDQEQILSRGIRASSTLTTSRAQAVKNAAEQAKRVGGEPKVFTVRARNRNLAGSTGGTFTSNVRNKVIMMSRTDESLSPTMRALMNAERSGKEVNFETIREALEAEAGVLKRQVQKESGDVLFNRVIEAAETTAEKRLAELRVMIKASTREFDDTIRQLGNAELGLEIREGASVAKSMRAISEAVDQPISRWGLRKMWALGKDERGGGTLDNILGGGGTNEQLVNSALRNARDGEKVGVELHKLRKAVGETLSTPIKREALDEASTSDLITLARAEQIIKTTDDNLAALRKMSQADLEDLGRAVLSPEEVASFTTKKLRAELLRIVTDSRRIREQLSQTAFPHLNQALKATIPPAAGKRAQQQLRNAFDEDFGSLAIREAELKKFTNGLKAMSRKTREPFLKQIFKEDASFAEWSFKVQTITDPNDPIWIQSVKEVDEHLRLLTKNHSGTNIERFDKLPIDVAAEGIRDVNNAMKTTVKTGGLSKARRKEMVERFKTMWLDLNDAKNLGKKDFRFDSGRRMKVLIEARGRGHSQKLIDDSFEAVRSLTMSGKAPKQALLDALTETMGADTVKALMGARRAEQKGVAIAYDIIGIPRMLMATFDISAPLRQGILLAPSHPLIFAGAFGEAIKVFFSAKMAGQLDDALRYGRGSVRMQNGVTEDMFQLGNRMGLYQAPWEAAGVNVNITQREEEFMSTLASKIWGIRQSERSYILFLNKLRADVFDHTIRGWAKAKVAPTKVEMKELAHFINVATGRGNAEALPKFAQGLMPILNLTFFSPRLAISRINVAQALIKAVRTPNSKASRLIMRDTAAFVGSGIGILSLGVLGGLWEADLDPLSADFGKVRIGNTSIDFWGGFKPYATFVARSSVAISQGDFGKVWDLFLKMGRTKFAPPAALVNDLIAGKDFLGRDLNWNAGDWDAIWTDLKQGDFKPGKIVKALGDLSENVIAERFIPLVVQDVVEAWRASERKQLETSVVGVGAFFGLSAVTYRRLFDERDDIRDEISNERYGVDFEAEDEEGNRILNQAQIKQVKEDERSKEIEKDIEDDRSPTGFQQKQNIVEEKMTALADDGVVLDEDGNVEKRQDTTQSDDNSLLSSQVMSGQNWRGKFKIREAMFRDYQDGLRGALGLNFPDEEATNAVDAAIDAYFDVDPGDFLDEVGDPIWDDYFAEKDKQKALAIQAGRDGDPKNPSRGAAEVEKYINPVEKDPVVREFRAASETIGQVKEAPKYRFLDTKQSDLVDTLIDKVGDLTRAARKAGGKNVPSIKEVLFRLVKAVGKDHPLYKVILVAFHVKNVSTTKSEGTSDAVKNPEKDEFVFDNPSAVRFYIGLYTNMSDENKIRFVRLHGTKYFTNEFIEREGLELSI